jgi:hypothetical protein
LSLPWDENNDGKHNKEMTNEQRDALRKKAKAMEKILQ